MAPYHANKTPLPPVTQRLIYPLPAAGVTTSYFTVFAMFACLCRYWYYRRQRIWLNTPALPATTYAHAALHCDTTTLFAWKTLGMLHTYYFLPLRVPFLLPFRRLTRRARTVTVSLLTRMPWNSHFNGSTVDALATHAPGGRLNHRRPCCGWPCAIATTLPLQAQAPQTRRGTLQATPTAAILARISTCRRFRPLNVLAMTALATTR